MQQETLPVEAFQSWLEAHHEEVIEPASVLEKWLTDYCGEPYTAGFTCYAPRAVFLEEGAEKDLPLWARCFQDDMYYLPFVEEMVGAHQYLSLLQETLQRVSAVPTQLDWSSFRTWVRSRWDVSAGETGSVHSCPLACWLSEQYGGSYSVDGVHYGPDRYIYNFLLPEWASHFVRVLDMRFPDMEVTADEVCMILDELGLM